MINKEEIEEMKEILSAIKPRELMDYSEFGEEEVGEVTYADYEAIQKAIEYISELEADNYEQNNIINNYIEFVNELEKERDYYKKMYNEFNNAFVKGGNKR